MTRWTLVLVVAGCSITVEPDDKATIGDGTPEGQTPSTPETGDPVDPTDPTGPGPGGCDGVYPGVYGGAADGDLEAEVVSAEMQVYVYSVSGDGFLDGILDLEADGTMYGESLGFWADGTLDWDTCTLSGDWGAVQLPGVPAGWWEAE